MDPPVTESARVKPIGLPAAFSELPLGTLLFVSGFGADYVSGPTSKNLKKSPMRTVSHDECDNFYFNALDKSIIESQICAEFALGHGTCQVIAENLEETNIKIKNQTLTVQ